MNDIRYYVWFIDDDGNVHEQEFPISTRCYDITLAYFGALHDALDFAKNYGWYVIKIEFEHWEDL